MNRATLIQMVAEAAVTHESDKLRELVALLAEDGVNAPLDILADITTAMEAVATIATVHSEYLANEWHQQSDSWRRSTCESQAAHCRNLARAFNGFARWFETASKDLSEVSESGDA